MLASDKCLATIVAMRILAGHRFSTEIACAVAIIGSVVAVDRVSIEAAEVTELSAYPPSGFRKIESVVEAPGGKFVIEQWWKRGAGEGGQDLYQTWLVPKAGSPVRLPEVTLAGEWEGNDSGSVGFPSAFYFSPDAAYIFREQKIAHGVNGARRSQSTASLFPTCTSAPANFSHARHNYSGGMTRGLSSFRHGNLMTY